MACIVNHELYYMLMVFSVAVYGMLCSVWGLLHKRICRISLDVGVQLSEQSSLKLQVFCKIDAAYVNHTGLVSGPCKTIWCHHIKSWSAVALPYMLYTQ